MFDLALIVNDRRLLDLPPLRGVTFSTGEHGYQDCQALVPVRGARAYGLYGLLGQMRLRASWLGVLVWDGRVEDVALSNAGVQLGAFGRWRALSDVPYTALWSDTQLARWEQNPAAYAGTLVDASMQCTADTNNRLYVTPNKNETFVQFGGFIWNYDTPSQSSRTIARISFDYEILLPAGWAFFVRNKQGNSYLSDTTTIAGTGALLTGTVNTTQPANTTRINLLIFWNSAGTFTVGVDTGVLYVKITNIRVQSTTASTVTADAIASDMIATIAATNAGQISASTVLIQAPGLDLRDEVYEDLLPIDILPRLASLGDTAGQRYEVGVYDDSLLYFQPRGSAGRTWYVDLADLQVQQTIDQLANSRYAVYQDADGHTIRTANLADADSVERYGLTRRRPVSTDTTSAATAATIRATALADTAKPIPRASLTLKRMFAAGGQAVPLFLARAGDTLVLRNLTPDAAAVIERLQSFRLAETTYACDSNQLTVVPESPLPQLEYLLARREIGIR